MKNLKNTIWNKRLPSYIGVLFLTLSIGVIGWLSSNAVIFGTKAAVSNNPKNVKITNISDASFTVSYITDDKVSATINYGKTQTPNQVAFDDRDKSGQAPAQFNIHYITVKNLEASTKYFFTITSGDKTFLNNNVPYEVTPVAKNADPKPSELLIKGKIGLEDGTIPTEAIVYVSLNSSRLLSTLADVNGEYNLDVSSLKDVSSDSVLSLQIFDATRQSKVSLLANQGNPVPLVILSKDYNFSLGSEPLEEVPSGSESATLTPAAFPTAEGSTATKPEIFNPEEKNQEFKDQQPLFRGAAIPGADVEITIESENPIKTTVKASANGNWQYRPDTKLAPGNHTITIKTVDASGIMRTITQSFVVFAEGSEFTEPSVSPTANPTTAPTATIAPTKVPTATPTIKATPTSVATIAPTATLTTSISQSPIPVTGNTSLVVTIIGIVATVSIGALLFFLTAL
jgi:hypothetical protein